jgi:hypothetical protein
MKDTGRNSTPLVLIKGLSCGEVYLGHVEILDSIRGSDPLLVAFAFVLGITLADSLMVILLVLHLHAQQSLQSPFNVDDRTVIAAGILDDSSPDNIRERLPASRAYKHFVFLLCMAWA